MTKHSLHVQRGQPGQEQSIRSSKDDGLSSDAHVEKALAIVQQLASK